VLIARGAFSEVRQLLAAMDLAYVPKMDDAQKKDLLFLRSRLAMAEGAGEEEARILEQIVALDPLDGEALILLGQHSQRTGNPEKAVFYFERAAGIDAFEADAKVRHAQLLITQSKYRDALPLLKRAQAIKPRDNVAQYLEQVERLAGGK
jgi:tetratricopeptide (TPR) repeat protein